jgi:ornithine decarboxylase
MLSTAKFILSKRKVQEQYDIVKNLTDVVSYSFKTNNDVGKVLHDETDSFFTIHSTQNIDKIKDKDRVWFYAQAWNLEEIGVLISKGVHKFIIDNESDLHRFLGYIKEYKTKVSLLLRMKLKENTVYTGKHFVFGMYSEVIKKLIHELKEHELVEELGIHFHRKTQNTSEWSLKFELEQLFEPEILEKIDYVNIGGGIPVRYKNFRGEVMLSIFDRIRETKEWLNNNNIKMIIEPGRFICGPSIILETTIMNMYENNIILNCSIFNVYMDTYLADVRLIVEDELPDGEGKEYCIKGCTPDSTDILRYKVNLTEKRIGDKIIFINAGAYNFYCDFCNLPRPKTVIVD